MGLGDDIVGSLATVLPILRNAERLVVVDNRMTDLGTQAVVKAVQGMAALTYLGKYYLRCRPGQEESCRSITYTSPSIQSSFHVSTPLPHEPI